MRIAFTGCVTRSSLISDCDLELTFPNPYRTASVTLLYAQQVPARHRITITGSVTHSSLIGNCDLKPT